MFAGRPPAHSVPTFCPHFRVIPGCEYEVWSDAATASESVIEEVGVHPQRDRWVLVSEHPGERQDVDPRRHRRLAAVCRRSCGVILWTFARKSPRRRGRPVLTSASAGMRRPRRTPDRQAPCRRKSFDGTERTNSGTGTDRTALPLVWPTAWSTPSCTALSATVSRRRRNSTSCTRRAIASPSAGRRTPERRRAPGAPRPRPRGGGRRRRSGRRAGG